MSTKPRRDLYAKEQEDEIAAVLLAKGYSQETLDQMYPGEKEALLESDDWETEGTTFTLPQ